MTLKEYININQGTSEEKRISFVEYLYKMMDKYGYSKPQDLYNKANITKQSWSVIISGKCNPSLNTCIKIVFTMKLTNHECKYLLKKAGYTLPTSSKYALIIRYCIDNKIYDIYQLNDYLEEYGYIDSLIG